MIRQSCEKIFNNKIKEIKKDFLKRVKEIYSLYFITTVLPESFRKLLKDAGKIPINIEGQMFSYEEFAKLAKPEGEVQNVAAGLFLILIYHLWENHCRDEILKKIFGEEGWSREENKDQICWNLMFSIARIRHSILKHRGKVNKEVEKEIKKLDFIKKAVYGEKIEISNQGFSKFISEVEKFEVYPKPDGNICNILLQLTPIERD